MCFRSCGGSLYLSDCSIFFILFLLYCGLFYTCFCNGFGIQNRIRFRLDYSWFWVPIAWWIVSFSWLFCFTIDLARQGAILGAIWMSIGSHLNPFRWHGVILGVIWMSIGSHSNPFRWHQNQFKCHSTQLGPFRTSGCHFGCHLDVNWVTCAPLDDLYGTSQKLRGAVINNVIYTDYKNKYKKGEI